MNMKLQGDFGPKIFCPEYGRPSKSEKAEKKSGLSSCCQDVHILPFIDGGGMGKIRIFWAVFGKDKESQG